MLTPLEACLVKLPGNVARDLKRLGEGAPLGDKARNGGAGCYVTAFRKLLNLQVDKPFSHGLQPSSDDFRVKPSGHRRCSQRAR